MSQINPFYILNSLIFYIQIMIRRIQVSFSTGLNENFMEQER